MNKSISAVVVCGLVIGLMGCAVQKGSNGVSSGALILDNSHLPASGSSTRVYGYAGSINCIHVQPPVQVGQYYEVLCHEFTGTAQDLNTGVIDNLNSQYMRLVFDRSGGNSQADAQNCFAQISPRSSTGQSFQVVGLRTYDSANPTHVILHDQVDCTQ